MRFYRLGLLALLTVALPTGSSASMFDDILGALSGGSGGSGSLSNTDITAGLKEALEKGTSRTVHQIGTLDGYWKNPHIRIPLPDSLQRPAAILRKAGYGKYADDLELRLNRAAETAVPLAKPIFLKAIKEMTFADVKEIWKGPDDAATRYFERKTTGDLTGAFTPLVHKELEKSGAVHSWRSFSSKYASIPFIGGYLKDDLDAYATRMALQGMFTILAGEEAKIRHDPAARTTELLRKVFGR
ncbi:MAG TPA: DUF4197 domain-containing protein [Mariprofundaceae bacterium]|nr:DUF4197 domain-containing protein [Mariprofundaceae bacterium]